ncbi:hypothetical protein [Planctomicrobium sp. SH664]|uniref:hypothetical protein n=1 Tax=Planctomicrobium sp. SH664 TaxID=3448125 RepID=UPI003F5B1DC9
MNRRRFVVSSTLSLTALWGCRNENPVSEAYHQHARELLLRCLDAWRNRDTRSLTSGTDRVRFVDDDLRSGWNLLAYQLVNPDQKLRPFEGIPVTLELEDKAKKKRTVVAYYQISLTPRLTVLRADP